MDMGRLDVSEMHKRTPESSAQTVRRVNTVQVTTSFRGKAQIRSYKTTIKQLSTGMASWRRLVMKLLERPVQPSKTLSTPSHLTCNGNDATGPTAKTEKKDDQEVTKRRIEAVPIPRDHHTFGAYHTMPSSPRLRSRISCDNFA